MNWQKLTPENKPPYEVDVIIRFSKGCYDASKRISDSEYGDLYPWLEGYYSPNEITHFCIIEEP